MSELFDFDAFLAGTQLARRTVGFYKVDHRDEIARLTREHDAMPADGGDQRISSKGTPRKALADRIAALRDEMEGSRVDMVIRTLTADEFKAIQGDDKDVFDQFATQSVEPKLTREQCKQFADRIGHAQWKAIMDEANALVLAKVAVPDFSQSVSQTLSPPPSSEN